MTELFYRGHPQQPATKRPLTLAEQMRKPALVYRGVRHNGEHAIEPDVQDDLQFYRGYKTA